MPLKPEIGSSGGQHYDVARAIQTFLHQLAEGGASVASAVIKELLQNADDAGATEVTVILDERNPAEGFFPEYGSLFAPALLIRNNAPFRLPKEMGKDELDDFTAICDVASGHKRAQATAAGRFGIGFNSVYFLTDTPVLFSRREVHVFDLLHRVFEAKGWRFPLEAFPATAVSSAGPAKVVLEWILPKAALGETRSFGELAADSAGDYRQALLRLPLRQTPEEEKSLHEDRFPDTEDRWRVLREMSEQAARSVLFLKHIRSISFGVLHEKQVDEVGWVKVTPNPPEFYRFLESVQELARNFDLGKRVSPPPPFDRKVLYRRLPDGNTLSARDGEVTWSFHIRHSARFDDQDLTELRKRLDRNEERAVPWVALAIPRDLASMKFDRNEVPAWRVFLPLRELGPSGCVYHAALFVGPSRQRTEFRTDGSDEARRKTEWNQRLVERALVPLLRDASMDMLDLLPDLIAEHPKDYLSLFPVVSAGTGDVGSLAEHVQRCFSNEPWCLRLHDIWGQEIELLISEESVPLSLEMVPDWLSVYRDRFKHLSNPTRCFIRYALGDALRARLGGATSVSVRRLVSSDVPLAVLAHEEPPEAEDLARLLRLLAPEEGISKGSIHDLWGLGHADDGSLLRYDQDVLYILHDPKAATGIHHALQSLGLRFERTEWVDPRIGLACMSLQERRSVDNLVSADEGAALELLRRVGGGNQHDVVSHAYAIKPVVEFLCSLDPSRRPGDLRLGFLVRTAQHELDRRPLGTILLKPEDPSVEDTALWDGLFRRTFAKVAPEFARELYPLLRRWPSCLDMMHAPDCRVAVARASNALEMLHHARISFPASYDRIGEEMNRSGGGANDSHRAAAERSAALLLEHADRSWANLDASQQLSVLALPIHRCADGRFVPLTDVSGSDLSLLTSRFRIQSDDDIQDAPIQVPECMLLQSVDPLIKRFYRRQLGLEEHGRAVVLKAVLRQIGTPGAPNIQLLRYLVRYYRETVERLAASTDMLQKEDAQELRRLFESAKTVPCTDGEWRPARYCPEVWETAEDRCLIPWMYCTKILYCTEVWETAEELQRQGWKRSRLSTLLTDILHGQPVVSLEPKLRELIRQVHDTPLQRLDRRSVAERAITSEALTLSFLDRVKLLRDNWRDRPSEVKRAQILDAVPMQALGGSFRLEEIEILQVERVGLSVGVVRHFAPKAADIAGLGRQLELPPGRVSEFLHAFGVPRVKPEEIEERVVREVPNVWPKIGSTERLQLLEYVGTHSLTEQLQKVASPLDVVCVMGNAPEWVVPADVISPKWQATSPPLLPPRQRPKVEGLSAEGRLVWDRWCGLQTLHNVLSAVVTAARALPVEQRRAAAKQIYSWIDRVASSDPKELTEALRALPWVLVQKGPELEFHVPSQVIVHDAGQVLLARGFWVPAEPLPKVVGHALTTYGLLTSPPSTVESVLTIAHCLAQTSSTPVAKKAGEALYALLVDMIGDDESLRQAWEATARERPVYHLFRNPERTATVLQVFIGDNALCEDFGDLLFCLKAGEDVRNTIVRLYRKLGVEERPSLEQVLHALSCLKGSGRPLKRIYTRLVEALDEYSQEEVATQTTTDIRVLACSGSYEPLTRCYWDAEIGQPDRVALENKARVIDASDRATRRLATWLDEHIPEVMQRLRDVARLELADDPRSVEVTPAASQVLDPWRDWFMELSREGSILREKVRELGLRLPTATVKLVPVDRIAVRYVLPDGQIVNQSASWQGLLAFHDGASRVFLRRADAERDYLEDVQGLEVLDEAVARQVAALLCPVGATSATAADDVTRLVKETLERPSVTLARIRRVQQQHFLHQYHDQVADMEFAPRFEEYQRTKEGTSRHKELEEAMQHTLEQQFVNARREQIRGYGYDEFSVFAELVQNAEDAYAQRDRLGMDRPTRSIVSFRYTAEGGAALRLMVEHLGRPFNYRRHGSCEDPNFSRDVEGVLRSAGSFKPRTVVDHTAVQTVGRFGLGFKSAYLITDNPRIHSGLWHFEIQAACLPKEIAPPADFDREATRIELPLRTDAKEFRDPGGKHLVNLLPFLRKITELELQNADSGRLNLHTEIEQSLPSRVDRVLVEKVAISGVSHVRRSVVRFLRCRHADHAGQLALYLAPDGVPAPWDEAFSRDMFVVLPLQARLGCGVAVSHLFEVQSGRTHLVDPEGNQSRFEEVAHLVWGLPEALKTCVGPQNCLVDVLLRFWTLWRWNDGDTESHELRRALARELADLPVHAAVVPTLDPDTAITLSAGPVFYFSQIPNEVQDSLIQEGVSMRSGNGANIPLRHSNVVPAAFASAYLRTCRFADVEPSERLVRLGWDSIGTAFKEAPWLAKCPELLSVIARSVPEEHLQPVLEWLPDCLVLGEDGRGHAFHARAQDLLPWDFPDRGHLPRRFLCCLSQRYDEAAVSLLCRAGLPGEPSRGQLKSWIETEDLTREECVGILRYLADDRWRSQEYYALGEVFRSPWFPSDEGWLTTAEAVQHSLIGDDVLNGNEFKAWLGILSGQPFVPPEVRPSRDAGKVLASLFDWWKIHGADWTRRYEERTYPNERSLDLKTNFLPNDRRERWQWLSLFLLGSLHTMGRTKPAQHKAFLLRCERNGWQDVFADPGMDAHRWIDVLESYLDRQIEQSEYYQWMTQFVRIFHLSRWLKEYVDSFLAINQLQKPFALDQITAPRKSADFQGGGPDAPPITKTLGMGACFVVRELTRIHILTLPHVHRYCFVPSQKVRDLLTALGCSGLENSSPRGVEWSRTIYEFLVEHLGEKAIFEGAFDLPLLALAESSTLQQELLGTPLATEGYYD